MAQETLLTPAGYEKLTAELDHLVNVWRPQIVQRIKEARELGDLKENGEYHAAKDEQGLYETKIQQIEERLRTARVVDDVDASMAGIGTTVVVLDADTGEREEYVIVGSAEADPLANLISIDSPIGVALQDRKPGETVEVQLPRGSMKLTLEKIKAS